MKFKTLEIRNEKKRQRRSNLVTVVAGTFVGLCLLSLFGLGVAGCKNIRKQNTEAADYIASRYEERLDWAKNYLVGGDTSKARNIAIRTLNDIQSQGKDYDIGFGGYSGNLPDLEEGLSEIAKFKTSYK